MFVRVTPKVTPTFAGLGRRMAACLACDICKVSHHGDASRMLD